MVYDTRQLQSDLSSAALQLLQTAERLFAEEGIDAVSTRQIARESAQKNPSALHYHFGDKSALIQAILDYRVRPVNEQRLARLRKLKQEGEGISIRQLVTLFVEPFVFELLKPPEDTFYISVLAQLYASRRGRLIYASDKKRARELHDITALLVRKLAPLSVSKIHLRLQLLGRTTISTVAEWHDSRISTRQSITQQALKVRSDALVDFLVAGLTAADTNISDYTVKADP